MLALLLVLLHAAPLLLLLLLQSSHFYFCDRTAFECTVDYAVLHSSAKLGGHHPSSATAV
jgi:hypothetical protein